MSNDKPAVITCAISGTLANRDQCPAIPYTPDEYAAEARRIVDEGGVHIHIHARTPDGTPSYEIEDFRAIRDAFLGEMNRLGIKPEHECFDLGQVGVLWTLLDMGVLHAPLHVDFVMGVVGGIRPTTRNLAAMVDDLPPVEHHWSVIGISREQWNLVAAALTLGGSVRVGLEDNLYLPDGTMARSNGDLVAKARQLALDVGRRPATVAEARARRRRCSSP